MKREFGLIITPLLVKAEIFAGIELACEKNGVPELVEKITVEYSNAMTRVAGYARYNQNLIKLSTKLLRRADYDEQFETVVHEACHLIAKFKHPETPGTPKKSHGWQWVQAMTLAGYPEARVYHAIPRIGLHRKKREPRFDCSCRKNFTMGKNLFILRICPVCEQEIIPHKKAKR